MDTIKLKAKKDSLKFGNMIVYTGYITVLHDKKYLYSKFSSITRLNREDALKDAKILASDLNQ